MLMVDAATGKVLASVPIGPGVDANAFDPGTGLAFASSSDGTLTVARPEGKDKLAVVQTLSTPKRSRTMTLDPKTHRLYVAAAEFGAADHGPRRQAAAPAGRRRLVQGRGLRDGEPARPVSPSPVRDARRSRSAMRHRGAVVAGRRWLACAARAGDRAGGAAHVPVGPRPRRSRTTSTWPRRGAAARSGRPRCKTAGQHPNPDLVFESTKDTPHQMLSLDIPFEPWKRSRRIDLAREELELADVDDAAAMQALRRGVRLAFYGLLAADEARDPRAVDGGRGDARARGGAGPVRGRARLRAST